MNFLTANIDRAIVMTQYDLRGFAHPMGFRCAKTPKNLDATTGNFMDFAAGAGGRGDWKPTDEAYVNYFDSSFEDYLAMCKHLADNCDLSEKEAINLIIQEIVKQNKEMMAEGIESAYLHPLEKSNRWGKAVLALAEAFEVKLELE